MKYTISYCYNCKKVCYKCRWKEQMGSKVCTITYDAKKNSKNINTICSPACRFLAKNIFTFFTIKMQIISSRKSCLKGISRLRTIFQVELWLPRLNPSVLTYNLHKKAEVLQKFVHRWFLTKTSLEHLHSFSQEIVV